ncbi:MAG: NAD-dependent protein deacylase [Candidatus Xenobiia bacterium LiM19]
MKKDSKSAVEKAAELLCNSSCMVAFTGAGVSTESGIPDFRSAKGIFRDLEKKSDASPEEILSYSYFIENPGSFYACYRKNLVHRDARPNDCHRALAALEKAGRLKAVITQNIDNLHQRAGNRTVIELHGNVGRCYCLQCRKRFDLDYILDPSVEVPRCEECGGLVKPDVIMYGERLDNEKIESAIDAISSADALLVIGTSLVVHPAAGMIRHFRGRRFMIINKSPTPYDEAADIVIRESAGTTMKMLVTLLGIPLQPDEQIQQ